MKTMKNKNIKKEILEVGRVTADIKKNYFESETIRTIRNRLEEMGLDRHMPLELNSTEIALITPLGILMQIRPSDRDQLGLWGGTIEDGETPEEGAIRELFEETGIKITADRLEFVEVDEHFHKYQNGDKAVFKAYRYIVRFEHVPPIITDEESVGAFMVTHTILSQQQEFVKRVLGELG